MQLKCESHCLEERLLALSQLGASLILDINCPTLDARMIKGELSLEEC